MQRKIQELATAVRALGEQWKQAGGLAFDEAETPAEVAEAAGTLRCALELLDMLDALESSQNDSHQSAIRAEHFGLGEGTHAERLKVSWPSGRVDVALDLPADQIVSVREGSGVVHRRPFVR